MTLPDTVVQQLDANPAAAMVTVGHDGRPKAVRVGLAVVDGKLWSSATEGRVRTARVRSDPRCTLYIQHSGYGFTTLEAVVTILDGHRAPELNLRLFRRMQHRQEGPLSWFGRELSEDEFLDAMRRERRLIFEFEVTRIYGI